MKYKPLIEALDGVVKVAHACGLPHIAGQLHTVRDIQDEAGVARLEDRLLLVTKLLRLRPLPMSLRPQMGEAVRLLGNVIGEVRYT